jgi:hypothetical protein
MGRKVDAPEGDLYTRWLKGVFKEISPSNRAVTRAINAIRKLSTISILTIGREHASEGCNAPAIL